MKKTFNVFALFLMKFYVLFFMFYVKNGETCMQYAYYRCIYNKLYQKKMFYNCLFTSGNVLNKSDFEKVLGNVFKV